MSQCLLTRPAALAAALLVGLGGFAVSGDVLARQTLRVAHVSSVDSLVNQALVRFADEVKEKTGGELAIAIYPDGQLGDEAPIADAVGAGAIDMGLGGALDAIDPRLNVVSLPFLFKDAANVHAFLDGPAGQELMTLGQDRNYILLGALDSGFRQFANQKHPIRNPADLASLKIRTPPNPVILATIKSLGALPQAIPYGEVYTSLQSGVVDGVEPELRDFYEQKWYEAAKYVTMSNYVWSANMWFMNKARYDSLSDQQREVLRAAAANSVNWYRGELDQAYKVVIQALEDKGVQFNDVDAAAFREKVDPVYQQFAKEWGETFVESVRAAAQR
ncbi:TRAP transporter substrate-binding protein [Castellaniella sp. GW247-6E4]|uniref:TRAP transporter substrate-binding protein n=1 Tax=Castellaniella sp. GW247-6E4 TaxID=3140380 RepID=UPI0033147C58